MPAGAPLGPTPGAACVTASIGPMPLARLAVLASGSGTLLHAMLGDGLTPAIVVADRPCRALDIAAEHGVPSELVERTEWGPGFDRAAYGEQLVKVLRAHRVDLVAMAGFGTVVPALPAAFPGRVLNTHPALLPAFKGWHAVRDALALGVKVTGTTVHVATEEVDDGPILAQEAVPVLPGDTEDTLHERIKQVERRLYPATIRQFIEENSSAPQHEGTALGLRQVRHRRARPRAGRPRGRPGVVGRHRGRPARRRPGGDRPVRAHGVRPDPRAPGRHAAPQGARGHPGRPVRPRPPGRHGRAGHRAVRPRGRERLPVRHRHRRLRPRGRRPRGRDRHRRSGHDPRRGQEPRLGRRAHRPGRLPGRARRAAGRRAGQRGHAAPAGAHGVRPHRRLRRRGGRVVRRTGRRRRHRPTSPPRARPPSPRPPTTVVPCCPPRSTWPTAASRWPCATARTPTSGRRCTGPPAAPACRRATPSRGGRP